jgi:hypothetical protein
MVGEDINHGHQPWSNQGYEAMLKQDTRTLQSAESRLTVTGPLRKKCGPVLFYTNKDEYGTNGCE